MEKDLRKKALFSRVIIATYEMAAEGLDLPTLNSMILGTPRSKTADQATGRMLRDKLVAAIQPCMIDFVDEWCEMAEAMYWKRHASFTSYLPQARIEFYDDPRTDTILGQYCKNRPEPARTSGVKKKRTARKARKRDEEEEEEEEAEEQKEDEEEEEEEEEEKEDENEEAEEDEIPLAKLQKKAPKSSTISHSSSSSLSSSSSSTAPKKRQPKNKKII